MNGDQFKGLINIKYNVDCWYWAPEAAIYKFKEHEAYNKEDLYQIAMIVLQYNEIAFKNRIQGIIKDDWLTPKTFEKILKEMIMVMNDLYQLYDPKNNIDSLIVKGWQIELLSLLKQWQ